MVTIGLVPALKVLIFSSLPNGSVEIPPKIPPNCDACAVYFRLLRSIPDVAKRCDCIMEVLRTVSLPVIFADEQRPVLTASVEFAGIFGPLLKAFPLAEVIHSLGSR
jgi:hypothetical protein